MHGERQQYGSHIEVSTGRKMGGRPWIGDRGFQTSMEPRRASREGMSCRMCWGLRLDLVTDAAQSCSYDCNCSKCWMPNSTFNMKPKRWNDNSRLQVREWPLIRKRILWHCSMHCCYDMNEEVISTPRSFTSSTRRGSSKSVGFILGYRRLHVNSVWPQPKYL